MKRIGLFGGSFDPPHIGHMLTAVQVMESCELDEVWFIPVHTAPHKYKKSMSSNVERLKMLEESTAFHEKFFISTVELERKGVSYTIDTVMHLKEKYDNTQFYFIVGGDMLATLHTWKGIEQLYSNVTFIAVERPGVSMERLPHETIIQIETKQLDISSTMIRERVKLGKSISYMVVPEVEAFIRKKGLYGEREST
ncbi:nicotinate-nucleotide adenylyltransferase [Alkalihalobacillus pseudalcaliphilus]|uniref:nicotinate-nucleotide adenylyltransferase n=1 Tax=Alkalihalobacillus pseudalcaliphilus TaxID=79884 RepID=UPI00064DB8F9|nr:nicotinate-nucleotide adenylyltransferase [Alkalihalobacillus pseudalcaliphilus]KMK75924.1 nicotinic acid mononucleotide adenylyltransferase [Alkalihalobacillus pseudalcaliphilus]